MTIRSDLSIDWSVSPRIITVDSPSIEVTMQDLLDTLRNMESASDAMDEKPIVDAAGKEPLGGGVSVGLTISLLNAKLAFEARPGPTYVQCSASGGNLVAFDDVGSNISAIEPTAFTQVLLTASSSATSTNSADLEHGSYNNGVTVDIISGVAGTSHPIGTGRQPVNNITDAKSIAVSRGFNRLYIRGNLVIGASDNVDNYILISETDHQATITFTSGCSTYQTNVHDSIVEGTTSGPMDLHNCAVGSAGISNFSGGLDECGIAGSISTANGSALQMFNCTDAMPGALHPEIYINGGTSGNVHIISGGIGINNVASGSVTVDANPGTIHLRNTCTGGSIKLHGVAEVIDESNGSKVNDQTSANLIWNDPKGKAVYIHAV